METYYINDLGIIFHKIFKDLEHMNVQDIHGLEMVVNNNLYLKVNLVSVISLFNNPMNHFVFKIYFQNYNKIFTIKV